MIFPVRRNSILRDPETGPFSSGNPSGCSNAPDNPFLKSLVQHLETATFPSHKSQPGSASAVYLSRTASAAHIASPTLCRANQKTALSLPLSTACPRAICPKLSANIRYPRTLAPLLHPQTEHSQTTLPNVPRSHSFSLRQAIPGP